MILGVFEAGDRLAEKPTFDLFANDVVELPVASRAKGRETILRAQATGRLCAGKTLISSLACGRQKKSLPSLQYKLIFWRSMSFCRHRSESTIWRACLANEFS
jgi:hypothetical protein